MTIRLTKHSIEYLESINLKMEQLVLIIISKQFVIEQKKILFFLFLLDSRISVVQQVITVEQIIFATLQQANKYL